MTFAWLGALFGFLAVALGAFGAHALRHRFDAGALEVWRTASLYHLVHAVALFALGLAADRVRGARVAGIMFVTGITIFSGTLYVLAITGQRWLGAITPVGGLALMAAWSWLAIRNARR
jgi:uncharacterized membrane protein YgdD (TMEM256/DUF423 family)